MKYIYPLCAVLVVTTAGCVTPTLDLEPALNNFGPNPTALTRSGNKLTISLAGTTVDGEELPNSGATTFKVYGDTANKAAAMYKETGNVRVGLAWLVPQGNIPSGGIGAMIQRLGAGEIEKSGSATYAGNYIGIVGNGTDFPMERLSFAIVGKASLKADFGDETVSGSITDRAIAEDDFSPSTNTEISIANITLAPTTISDAGTFSGSVTGGEINTATFETQTPGTGSSIGVFAGANGQEVAGALSVKHTIVNKTDPTVTQSLLEMGVFHADKQ